MGLEVVVRPVVLPDIRPPIARRIAPPDDPTKGLCVLGGGGGGTFIGTATSQKVSITKQKPQIETKRQVDVERVYQVDDKGKINRDNFVEVERMKKFRASGGRRHAPRGGDGIIPPYIAEYIYAAPPEERSNVEVMETDKTVHNPDTSGLSGN